MGKKCPQKIVKFYFCLKHPKMTTADVEDEVVSALVLNSMCLSPKNQKCHFIARIAIFPELPFYFPEVLFCLPEVPFYLICVFQMVFSKVIVLSTCPAQSCSERQLPCS